MRISYVRQYYEGEKYIYLNSPDMFSEYTNPYRKNIMFVQASEIEEDRVHFYALGHEFAEPRKALINRVYNNRFVIHYVVSGEGEFNGKPVSAGDSFICWPQEKHTILSNPENPFEIYWAIIVGDKVSGYVTSLGFNKEKLIFKYNWQNEIIDYFNEVLYKPHTKSDLNEYFSGQLKVLMSYHKKANQANKRPNISQVEKYINRADRKLSETNYSISAEDLAKHIGISRKYLSSLYLKLKGTTLQNYITYNKMVLAKNLLAGGNYRVNEVASILGYDDYVSFSRAFKNHFGLSPRHYIGFEGDN